MGGGGGSGSQILENETGIILGTQKENGAGLSESPAVENLVV